MGTPPEDMTGVLLAGGRSLRMGRDKRFLELDGRALLDLTLGVLETLFSEVIVAVAEPEPRLEHLRHRLVTDLIPDCAALGGLYTALAAATTPRIFAAACDMPLLNPAVITRLVSLGEGADVVMVRLASGLQPMHAVYSKACLPHLERMARGKQLSIQDLIKATGLAVRILSEEEVQDLDPQFLSFLNVNTPADFEFVRKLLAERR
jgi:molybdopterin-guanine dinucleotide biosynthesis protein A